MSARNTKGVTIHLVKGTAAGTALVPTAITSAKPAVVTVANSLANGDLIFCNDTGFPELDGRFFTVGAAAAASFTLLGSDTSNTQGTLAASPSVTGYENADLADLTGCLGELNMARNAPQAVEAGTFRDPTQTITNQVVMAGTFAFKGPIDISDAGYAELLVAEQDGQARGIRIDLPGNGSIVAPVTVGMVMWDTPLNGAQGFSGTMVLSTAPTHCF